MRFLCYLFALFSLQSCFSEGTPAVPNSSTKKTIHPMTDADFLYDLNNPKFEVKLPKSLVEISGICLSGDTSLLAIQDEHGIVFELSAADGQLKAAYPFGEDHDYEGIALVDEILYVLRSDGTIFEIRNWQHSPTVDSFITELSIENDTEGLCYEPKTHSLLIACKGKSELNGGEHLDRRNIYRFSLETRQLDSNPAYVIDRAAIYQYLSSQNPENIGVTKLVKNLVNTRDELFFGPSDIAIHPLTHDLYIPASKGNCLFVLHPNGQIKHCIYLSPKQFRQPEGIIFDKEARLYIASEGAGKKAQLFCFELK